MKYFTQELLDRYGSDDPSVYKKAEVEWEEQCEKYNAYLRSVKSDLPAGLRLVEENYYLHNAQICGMGERDQTFVILLRLDTPPHSLLLFNYNLLQNAEIDAGANGMACARVEWQYDEIEQVAADPPVWLQSILLSNGWEVRLRFRNIQVQEVQAVLPVPDEQAHRSALPARSA